MGANGVIPCTAYQNDQNLVAQRYNALQTDNANLAAATCALQQTLPGGSCGTTSSGFWVGLALVVSVVSGGVALEAEGAVAEVAGFISAGSSLVAAYPDFKSCVHGDQGSCLNVAISMIGAAMGVSGEEAAGDAEALTGAAHGTFTQAEMNAWAKRAGIGSLVLSLGSYILDSANPTQ